MNRATLRRTNLYRDARSRNHLFWEAANKSDRMTLMNFLELLKSRRTQRRYSRTNWQDEELG
jgi:hypothetical protein